MIGFTKRNIKLFLRDKGAVFFSILGVLIVIGSYILFLGDVWLDGMGGIENAKEIMNNWIMAGVLAITAATTILGILENMVKDKSSHIFMDFYVSPLKRKNLMAGYMLSAFIVGIVMSLIAFAMSQIYIVADGGSLITLGATVKILGLIVLSSFLCTSMMMFIVSFFNSLSAYTSASAIIGTLIGFLTGIYLPIGSLPNGVQTIIKIFPVSHTALLFREVMTGEILTNATEGATVETVARIKSQLGMVYTVGGNDIAISTSVIYVIACGIIFILLTLFNLSRKKK